MNTADQLANHIQRLQHRRQLVAEIHRQGQLTRATLAALWRTARHADTPRLILWTIQTMHSKRTQP